MICYDVMHALQYKRVSAFGKFRAAMTKQCEFTWIEYADTP